MGSILILAALVLVGLGHLGCPVQAATLRKAVFAGGCFWCMEPPFAAMDGVVEVTVGYTGGAGDHPSYTQISSGQTGHYEAVQVVYDPDRVSYAQLLTTFWQQIDPMDGEGQFADRGSQYRTAIFVLDQEQERLALQSKRRLEQSGRVEGQVATQILPAARFYPAEEYHQRYARKNPIHYARYKTGSGRAAYLAANTAANVAPSAYPRPTEDQLRARLTPLQYRVTQEEGTEPPFDNPYHDNKRAGIYVDVVSGEPLFSSLDKFDSGTGWPSFTRPLVADNVVEREDRRLFVVRVEVRSRHGDSHLGHVFDDGPPPTGLRYCINSASLRFIPVEDLANEGYGEFIGLFER